MTAKPAHIACCQPSTKDSRAPSYHIRLGTLLLRRGESVGDARPGRLGAPDAIAVYRSAARGRRTAGA